MPCHAFASPPSDRFHTERSPTKIRECCLLRQFPKDLRDCNRQIVLLCNQIPTVFQNEKPLCCLLFPLAASTQFCILASCDLLISRLDSRPILLWESARVPVSRPVTQLNVPGESSLFEIGLHCDPSIQHLRDRTTRFGVICSRLERLLGSTRNFRPDIKVDRGDRKPVIRLLQSHSRFRLDALGGHPRLTQLPRKGHRETACMRGSNQFLRIGSGLIFKPRFKGIWCV